MPAADTPESDGLGFDHLSELLRRLFADRRVRGLEITIFDPDLDEEASSRTSSRAASTTCSPQNRKETQ
jgi:arginase family enzyme